MRKTAFGFCNYLHTASTTEFVQNLRF